MPTPYQEEATQTASPLSPLAYNSELASILRKDILERKLSEEALQRAYDELETLVQERTRELAEANAALQAQVLERQRVEAQLQQQQLFLRNIIDTVPAMIFVKDDDGRFLLVNRYMANLKAAQIEDVVGKRDIDFIPSSEYIASYRRNDLEVIQNRCEKFIAEEIVTDAQGNPHWFQTVKRPLLSADGTTYHVLGVATDITHRKQAEERIHALNAELEKHLHYIKSLHHDLQHSTAELEYAYDVTIEGWSRALDLRDRETEGHARRVTEMTLCLAHAFEISEQEIVHIRRGALLHDIGKMGVPDHILLKPGPLTPDERLLMQQHTVYAHEMLSPIAFLHPALDIPFYHHEKWDGTGYPHGLKGETIPLAARIFAIVDVWDALCSDRPYRQGWPKEQVAEYIRSLSGAHFDPQVVKIFFEMLGY